jgi:hypothetical protein
MISRTAHLFHVALTVVLAVVLVVALFMIRDISGQLKNALVDKKVQQAAAKGTEAKPIIITVPVPGPVVAGGAPQKLQVTVYTQPATPAAPGQPAQPPKVVATAPAVPCISEADCRAKFGAAQQSIATDAQITPGTIATVCLVPLDANKVCPPGKEANLPLSKPLPFHLDLALTAKGVFTAIVPRGGPLEVTQVRTFTAIEAKAASQTLTYHLAAPSIMMISTLSGITGIVGVSYQNYGPLGGVYKILPGYVFSNHGSGWGIGLGWERPLW